MKIKVKVGSTVVIDGAEMREQPNNWRVNGSPVNQVAQYLRAAQARVHQRGNVQTTITFQCAKEHASLQAAILYCMTHYRSMILTGTALFVFESDGGATTNEYLANASCHVSEIYPVGLTTFATYNITGGKPQATSP